MYILTQTWAVTYNMIDPLSWQEERPMTNKTANILTTTKIWSWVPEGLSINMAWPNTSCKVTLAAIRSSDNIHTGSRIKYNITS